MNHDHPSPMLLRGAKHPNVHPLLSTSPLDPKLISTVHLLSPPSISAVRLISLPHLLAHHFSSSSLDPSVPKLISTVYLLSPPSISAVRLMPLRHLLSPSNAAAALRRLPDARDSLAFFHLTRTFFRIPHPIESYDHLVRVLCAAGLREFAAKVFDEMLAEGHSPDAEVLGVLVLARARAGELDEAVRLVFRVWESGFEIDAFIVNDLVSRLMARDRGTEGIRLFREGLQSPGFRPDTCSFNIVIKGLCRLGDLDEAFEVFESMERFGCVADPITKNTLIDGLCRAKKVDMGRELLTRFRSGGSCSLTVVSYTSVISSYCKTRRIREAFEVLDEMVMSGIEPNVVTYNVIIDAYGKMGDMASALSMYEQMKASRCSPDIVTFTSLIDGYCRKGLLDDAMRIWHQIRLNHLWPNAYTFAIVINALCKWNRFSEARALLTELKSRRDIIAKPFMYNPVIDGFCKAGNLDEAISIKVEMEENRCFPDKVTYTILMIGYCMKGRMSEAIFLFHKMIISGCAPDTLSINCLVSCLLKAGMPMEASRIVGSVSPELPSRNLSSSREIQHVSRRNADVMLAA